MSIKFSRELPSAEELKNDFPMTEELCRVKSQRDREILYR